jgi:hypothetical protein
LYLDVTQRRIRDEGSPRLRHFDNLKTSDRIFFKVPRPAVDPFPPPPQSIYQIGTREIFAEAKGLGGEAELSPPLDKVTNEWSYTSTLCFLGINKILTLLLLFE